MKVQEALNGPELRPTASALRGLDVLKHFVPITRPTAELVFQWHSAQSYSTADVTELRLAGLASQGAVSWDEGWLPQQFNQVRTGKVACAQPEVHRPCSCLPAKPAAKRRQMIFAAFIARVLTVCRSRWVNTQRIK